MNLAERIRFLNGKMAGKTFKHFKGKLYRVFYVGLCSETEQPVVVYVPLYPSIIPVFSRPVETFLRTAHRPGSLKPVARYKIFRLD